MHVEFVVQFDGSLGEVKVIKGIGYGCDEEAIKAVKNSKPWSVGMVRGQPVRHKIVLPLTFSLN